MLVSFTSYFNLLKGDIHVARLKVDRLEGSEYDYLYTLEGVARGDLLPWGFHSVLTGEYIDSSYRQHNAIVHKWVQARIFSSYRYDKEDLLKKLKLEKYDELAILLYNKGKSPWDDYRIEGV